MFTFFKYLFYTLLVAVIFLFITTVLLATITSNGIDDFKNYLVTYPIIFFLPFLLVLSYLFMVRLRKTDGWATDEVPKQSRYFYPLVGFIILVAIGTYYFYLHPNPQLSYASSTPAHSNATSEHINHQNTSEHLQPESDYVAVATTVIADSVVEPMRVETVRYNTSSKFIAATNSETVERRFTSRSKAYFYDEPNIETRRNDFIKNWNKAYLPLNALKESNDFIYVNFPTKDGSIKSGWLHKKDLKDVQVVLESSK